MKESLLQQQVRQMLSIYGIFHFAVMNESAMMILNSFKIPSKTKAIIITHLKKMGLTPGIPDLCILGNKTIYFMEFKVGDKVMNEQQILISTILRSQGYQVAEIRSYAEAKKQLEKWGVL